MQSLTKLTAVAAMAIGVGAGSYGIAGAASGNAAATTATTTTTTPAQTAPAPPGRSGQPWGAQRSDETLLTGDTLAKVQAAAVAKVGSGATVVRAETDADGHAKYEVHMTQADGTPITVYVDDGFAVVSVESR